MKRYLLAPFILSCALFSHAALAQSEPATASTTPPDTVLDHHQKMQQLHENYMQSLQQTQDPAERQKMMQEYMQHTHQQMVEMRQAMMQERMSQMQAMQERMPQQGEMGEMPMMPPYGMMGGPYGQPYGQPPYGQGMMGTPGMQRGGMQRDMRQAHKQQMQAEKKAHWETMEKTMKNIEALLQQLVDQQANAK